MCAEWIFNSASMHGAFESAFNPLSRYSAGSRKICPETRTHSERSTRKNRISRRSTRPFEILMTRGPLCNYREANGHAKREKKKKKKKKNKKKRKN